MKSTYYVVLILMAVISASCQKDAFDFSKVKLDDSFKNYSLENKNIFIKNEFESPHVVVYEADENTNMIFGSIQLDSTLLSQIIVYEDKIAGIKVHSSPKLSLEFIEKIMKINGKPTHVIKDKAHLDAKVDQQLFGHLRKLFPNDVAWVEDEPNSFRYPYAFFWDKGYNYSILSFTIDYDGRIRNTYTAVTKKAFKNNAIPDWKFPPPLESPWYNYMK